MVAVAAPFIVAVVIFMYARRQGDQTLYPVTTNAETPNPSGIPNYIITESGKELVGYVPDIQSSDSGTLPRGFPSTLITEKGIEFAQSFRIDHAEGYAELTVAYESARTIEANRSYFSAYLTQYGWNVVEEHSTEGSYQFNATHETDGMAIVVDHGDKKASSIRIDYYSNGAHVITSGS